jgi:hypothetical protein
VLETSLLIVPGLHTLISHPKIVLGYPGRRVSSSAPENHTNRRFVELNDHVGMIADPPKVIPLPVIFKVGVVSPKSPGSSGIRWEHAERNIWLDGKLQIS